jgi:hypothetical protein
MWAVVAGHEETIGSMGVTCTGPSHVICHSNCMLATLIFGHFGVAYVEPGPRIGTIQNVASAVNLVHKACCSPLIMNS